VNKEKLKNILTKIGEVNPEYTLDKQVYNVGRLIQFMDNPSEELQLAVVKKNGWLIRFIENPSETVQLVAVEKNPYLIQYIQNPTKMVKDLYREKISFLPKKIITRIGKFFGR